MSFVLFALLMLPMQDQDSDLPVQQSKTFQEDWGSKGGIEFYFKPVGNETDLKFKRDLVRAVFKRLAVSGHDKIHVSFLPGSGFRALRVRVAGLTESKRDEIPDLFLYSGRVEEREVADREIHQKWDGTKENAPEGWFAIQNDRKMTGDYDHFSGEYILVSKDVVITGADIKKARKEQDFSSGGWSLNVILTREAGKRFDEMAKKLYNQSPRGLIAIIIEGKIVSKPIINAEKFGGWSIITGSFSEKEVTGLALSLANPFPCSLEFREGKVFGPGGKER